MYERPFIQLTWGGRLPNDEIWANGLHLINTGLNAGPESLEAYLSNVTIRDNIVDVIAGQHTSTTGPTSLAQLEWVKFALLGRDGKYLQDSYTGFPSADLPGGGPGGALVMTSVAVSFKTEVRRGPAANGRIYPPGNVRDTEGGYFQSMIYNGELAASWAQTIRNINAVGVEFTNIRVGNVSKVGNGSQAPITRVEVGNVIDVQRRRKNRIREVYSESTV